MPDGTERKLNDDKLDRLEREVETLKSEVAIVRQATTALALPLQRTPPSKTRSLLDLRKSSGPEFGAPSPKLVQLDRELANGTLSVDDYATLVCREDSLLQHADDFSGISIAPDAHHGAPSPDEDAKGVAEI
jgi:hypothetical protein